MDRFRGIHALNVDPKSRIAVPVKYRAALSADRQGRVVLTIDTEERCLLLYPLARWEGIEAKVLELPGFDAKTRRIQRLLIGHASELELDKSGRILLPSELRNYAGIAHRVMLIGQGHKFELWGDTQWEQAREKWLLRRSASDEEEMPEALRSITL